MTKYFKTVLLPVVLIFSIASCSKTKTYADYLKEERENISKYINANNIAVQNFMPKDGEEWKTEDGRDIYYQSTLSGIYYHQIEKGTGSDAPALGYTVTVRYTGRNFSGIEIYNCTPKVTPDPESFEISASPAGKKFGTGFQEAVKYMRAGGHCKVILPFNAGNAPESTYYTPMLYEIWLIRVE